MLYCIDELNIGLYRCSGCTWCPYKEYRHDVCRQIILVEMHVPDSAYTAWRLARLACWRLPSVPNPWFLEYWICNNEIKHINPGPEYLVDEYLDGPRLGSLAPLISTIPYSGRTRSFKFGFFIYITLAHSNQKCIFAECIIEFGNSLEHWGARLRGPLC